MKKKSHNTVSTKPEYEPSPEEYSSLRSLGAHLLKSPRVRVSRGASIPMLVPDHPDEAVGWALLAEAIGTEDLNFISGLVSQLANAGSKGSDIDEQGLNFMLSVVKGIKPKDPLESMLAAQMAAVHMASMTLARRLGQVENLEQQDSAERAFTRLAKTFASQLEAMKRYRTGGEQKVTVQHVTVSEGGQAIVGNVTQAPQRGTSESSPKAIADARGAAMPILAEENVVPAQTRPRRK